MSWSLSRGRDRARRPMRRTWVPRLEALEDRTAPADLTAPTASIAAVSPNIRAAAVDSLTISFDEPVTGLDLSDLRLTRDDVALSLAGAALATTDQQGFTLSGLTALTSPAGDYALTLRASGSGIQDASGNSLAVDASTGWTRLLAQDDFERSDGSNLGPNWTESVPDLTLAGGRLKVVSTIGVASVTDVSETDVILQADLNLASTGIEYGGLVARYGGTGDQNMYWAEVEGVNGAYSAVIWKNVNGTWTALSRQAVSTGTGTLRFEVVGSSLKLFFNNQLVGRAIDTSLAAAGKIGFRGYVNTTADNFRAERVERVDATLPFGAEFNLADGSLLDPTVWQQILGDFQVRGSQLVATGPFNLSIVHGVDAADVALSMDVALTNNATVQYAGLVARYSGAGADANMYWGVITNDNGALTAEIWRNVAGTWTRLARNSIPTATGRLDFLVHGTSLQLSLNGELIASAVDSKLATGGVGIRGYLGTAVDNFRIGESTLAPAIRFVDSFLASAGSSLGLGWLTNAGSLSISGNQVLFGVAQSLATLGGVTLADSSTQVEINLPTTGIQYAGLVARYDGPGDQNMYWGELEAVNGAFTAVIWKNVGGVWTELSRQAVATGSGTLRFDVIGNQLQLFLNGKEVGAALDTSLVSGSVGIRGYQGTLIDNFRLFNGAVGPVSEGNQLLTLHLKPLDINLLGLQITSSPITVTVTTEGGDGKLLGNVLNTVSSIINLDEINAALNNVLGATVDLLNSIGLEVAGVGQGSFDTAPVSTTPILELFVAPVHLDLLGAQVNTSPIRLNVVAHSGNGLILGNVLTELTDLFNPPLPDELDLAFINDRLAALLNRLNNQIPGIAPAPTDLPTLGPDDIVTITVPAIDLNLLGLVLETTPITVNASAETGPGLLLGNLLQTILNELEATPEERSELSGHINSLLAKVVGVLNASSLTLPSDALDPLSQALRTLSLPDLIAPADGASVQILDLVIASNNGPPVQVDLLGVHVTTSNIDANLSAVTGEGLVLGNLLYNVANLLNPDGPLALVNLITDLATGSSTAGTIPAPDPTTGQTQFAPTQVLTLTVPAIDIDLLGLQVQTSPITVTVRAQEGDGKLLGNLLRTVSTLINPVGVSNALNNVLSSAVGLLNSASLTVSGVTEGSLSNAPASMTPVLNLFVAPVHVDLLGALVDTSAITVKIIAHSGQGNVLGNVVTELANLFNPPLPDELDLAELNDRLVALLGRLTGQTQTIGSATIPPPPLGEGQILSLTVPAIDLDLLGLLLQTSPITVNANAETGDGRLLGNVVQTLLNTLDATPQELSELSGNLNNLLAKVVGVLNASSLLLSGDLLSGVLRTLSVPGLTGAQAGAIAPILDLVISSTNGTSPPVELDLLGVVVTTSDIDAHLAAQTGDGKILGNLLYNVSHLLDPGASASLLYLLTQLGRTA